MEKAGIPIQVLQSYETVKSDEEVFEKLKQLEQYRIKRDEQQIISKNEMYEDIMTESICYLLIPYVAAELYGRLRENRMKAIELSQRFYEQFLDQMVHFNFIKKQFIEVFIKGDQQKQTLEQLRNSKIERMQQIRGFKEILKSIENKRATNRNDFDEEDERKYWKYYIKVCILESIDNYHMNKREYDMLKEIAELKEKGEYEMRKQKDEEEAEKRRGGFKTITIPKQPDEQFVQMNQFNQINQNNQFNQMSQMNQQGNYVSQGIVQGYNQPQRLDIMNNVFNPRFKYGRMMTDQDWELEKEEEMMKPNTEKPKTSEDDDSNDDEEKWREQREWDEFKDEHRRGSGNTFNMG